MDDRRLDLLEQALLARARTRTTPGLPAGFTAGVLREVRRTVEQRSDFWSSFACAGRRFVPAGALAATATFGYAQLSERLLNQALLSLSLQGGATAFTLAGLLP